MKETIPVIKNKEYELEIESMGFQGEGVAKVNNFTVFIPGAIVGEKVRAKILKIEKKFAFGKVVETIKNSPSRKVPRCGIYERCGGCNLQHISYEGQLEYKRNRVMDTLNRIGKVNDVIIHHTIGMKEPYSYRNKVQLPVGESNNPNNPVSIGFYQQRSHNIIDMNVCYIQDEASDVVIKLTRRWMKKYNIAPYSEEKDTGLIKHIMIRKGFRTGEIMIVLVTKEQELPHAEEFVSLMLENIEGVKSIVQNVNPKNTNVILGNKNNTLWGSSYITDYIGRFKFNISPLSFFQINPVQTEELYSKVLEYASLTGEETVFDAYCGTGTISLFLSQKAKKVYGVEVVEDAIKDAIRNSKENKVNNVEFIVGESEKEIPALIEKGVKPDVVVVDPPRKGCHIDLLKAIAEASPEKIIYVSCDPATLARDLGILEGMGYKTIEVQPVDMFPQTAHIESVCKLVRVTNG
ncbi:23S rRNA (uracil(1939)-C(5))-methyltransferase RlmD [Hathewaya massiliensis]|uniref:23S rRNA (uracil(1939)-C(5))-methyltransferase RlmD n=1 Tax=Hathewaya massiliensis TaxID=1964382 RepID=UPI001157538C|nr:23S rRNA (uracil(1939)-C(5))-methyltransferase RlmD [Hathewaya massiliensis]